MSPALQKMFRQSTFTILPDRYIFASVSKKPVSIDCFMITQDQDEITVITPENNISKLKIVSKNDNLWKLVSINLATPFMVGTLAEINSACAAIKLNNLIVSTYSKDYLFIKDSQSNQIASVLTKLGFKSVF